LKREGENAACSEGRGEIPRKQSSAVCSDGTEERFRPFFIVGCQRSGTTELAVMFDRHSAIAVPPETQFFCKFVPADSRKRLPMTHEQLLARTCNDPFILQAGLRYEDAIERFRHYSPTYENLFRVLLETHAAKQGKRRAAEKSCDHIGNVDQLLREYPESKVICVIRDGRDVMRSTSAAWGQKNWTVMCHYWTDYAKRARFWLRTLPPDRFTVVKYGDLIRRPAEELSRLCTFVGEDFEPSQLESCEETKTVPESELAWKGKAREGPDPSRVDAWRRCEDHELIAKFNFYMGPMLREWGYTDTEVVGIPWTKRLLWWIQYIPCWPVIYPVALRVNRALRALRVLVTGQALWGASPDLWC